jgi:hypothetical protein
MTCGDFILFCTPGTSEFWFAVAVGFTILWGAIYIFKLLDLLDKE